MKLPYEWQPKIISTQLAFLGNFVIAGVPGEFTTMSGRRLRETIKDTISKSNTYQNAKVVIAGLVNTYSDYITTPEEYEVISLIDLRKIEFVSFQTIFTQNVKNLVPLYL